MRTFNPKTRKIVKDRMCLNPECECYQKTGSMVEYSTKKRPTTPLMYECLNCRKRYSSRKGTPFFGLRKSNEKIIQALQTLAEKGSIRGAGRIVGVTKDTLCSWLKLAATQCDIVNEHLVKELDFDQVQLDELWTFVKKKTTYQINGNEKKSKRSETKSGIKTSPKNKNK